MHCTNTEVYARQLHVSAKKSPGKPSERKQFKHPGKALEVAVNERVYNDGEYMVTEGMECHEVLISTCPVELCCSLVQIYIINSVWSALCGKAVMLCRGTVNILSDDVVVVAWLHPACIALDSLRHQTSKDKVGIKTCSIDRA